MNVISISLSIYMYINQFIGRDQITLTIYYIFTYITLTNLHRLVHMHMPGEGHLHTCRRECMWHSFCGISWQSRAGEHPGQRTKCTISTGTKIYPLHTNFIWSSLLLYEVRSLTLCFRRKAGAPWGKSNLPKTQLVNNSKNSNQHLSGSNVDSFYDTALSP